MAGASSHFISDERYRRHEQRNREADNTVEHVQHYVLTVVYKSGAVYVETTSISKIITILDDRLADNEKHGSVEKFEITPDYNSDAARRHHFLTGDSHGN